MEGYFAGTHFTVLTYADIKLKQFNQNIRTPHSSLLYGLRSFL